MRHITPNFKGFTAWKAASGPESAHRERKTLRNHREPCLSELLFLTEVAV